MRETVRLKSYNGTFDAEGVAAGRVEEYGLPLAPVKISTTPDGSAVCLDLDPDATDHPSVVLERQTDRWALFVTSEEGGDSELLVYILDDGRVVATPNCVPPPTNLLGVDLRRIPEHGAVPDPLPASKCRFGIPKPKAAKSRGRKGK